ncbi:MAG: beta-lactamase induction signal transducer, partial [Pseudomonadota bacterium]
AFVALVISLISPTHDLLLDAWRIEVARTDEDKDLMSALYQFGYKSAGFITGFFALLMADYYGWTFVFVMVAGFMVIAMGGTMIAPEPAHLRLSAGKRTSFYPSLPREVIRPAVLTMAASWSIALFLIVQFVVQALGEGASGRVFVQQKGPWIVALTVIAPALVSAALVFLYKGHVVETNIDDDPADRMDKIFATLFRAIYDPFMDLMARLRWGVILVLLLALTYRFTDAVWGSFAYPFYLGENFGAIGHTLTDVGIASKFFGVIATILGSLIGAILIAAIGRMPVFFVGGIVAAVTNLLYADLAAGAAALDAFLAFTYLDVPLVAFAEWAAQIQPDEIALAPDQGQRMARLMITIFAENIAGGLALVAMTAYLTSVVNPRFAAVQYALLASLTMLIGTLGRPWLGEMIELRGFYYVFIVTFWLGGVAVVLSAIEWWRQSRDPSAGKSLILDA